MSTFIRSALVAAALLTSASATMAASRIYSVPDLSDQFSGYTPNSPEGIKAFWEYEARNGD
ncbi:MAG: hypothetical protein WBP94_00425 [Rhodomicrobiaceae bacterium]